MNYPDWLPKDYHKPSLTFKEVKELFNWKSEKTVYNYLERDLNFPRPFKRFRTVRFKTLEVIKYFEDNIRRGE
jgi:predicted DNA-binding transcriptional regulator AlpA